MKKAILNMKRYSSSSSLSSSNIKIKHYPVVIVGGGPVGLLFSLLLSQYNVKHYLLEKRLHPTVHPQAHFINTRSMEIIRTHFPSIFNEMLSLMPSHNSWRDFVYCHTVIGKHLARLDHFDNKTISSTFWEQTPTAVIHLPQNKFEDILRKNIDHNNNNNNDNNDNNDKTISYGAEVININYRNISNNTKTEIIYTTTNDNDNNNNKNDNNHTITCDYLIAADGSNSYIRRKLGIPMIGNDSLQTLLNVHFKCKGLDKFLQPRPAMLYFCFNEHMVSVFVAHDPIKDEWVCQIPIFPPFQTLKDYNKEKLTNLLSLSLGLQSINYNDVPKLEIMNINHWTMHSQVADTFQGDNNTTRNIFLIGDCAHRFPPSGGFGMNTGIQDAHNLAWKLSMVTKGISNEELLTTYNNERKPIANANASLSMRNYDKSSLAARLLGVDPVIAKIAINAFTSSIASSMLPMTLRSIAVNTMVTTGLSTLKYLKYDYDVRTVLLKNMINSGKSLPLIFPKEDIGFQYHQGCIVNTNTDTSSINDNEIESISALRVGGRMPHCWLQISNDNKSEKYILSTLDLPSYIHKTTNIPTLLLMINNNDYSKWKEVIDKNNANNFITIIRIRNNNNNELMTHQNLQQMMQEPGYMHNTPVDNDNNLKHNKNIDIIKNNNSNNNNNDSIFIFEDITNRLTEISKKHNNLGIVIRPDGHILGIQTYDDNNNDINSLSKFIKNIITKMSI